MEIETKIISIENALSRANKPYWKIMTTLGPYNCHESSVVDRIKEYVGGMCHLMIRETPKADGNGTWKNVIGLVEDSVNEPKTQFKQMYEAKELYRTNEEKPQKQVNGNFPISMKVSYAKDIFIVLSEKNKDNNIDEKTVMILATDLVKQAEEAFS